MRPACQGCSLCEPARAGLVWQPAAANHVVPHPSKKIRFSVVPAQADILMYGKPVHVHGDMAKNEVHRPQVGQLAASCVQHHPDHVTIRFSAATSTLK